MIKVFHYSSGLSRVGWPPGVILMGILQCLGISLALITTVQEFVQDVARPSRGVYLHEEAGLEIPIPERWTYHTEDELLVVNDPTDELALLFLTSELQVLERFTDVLIGELARIIEHPEVTNQTASKEVNGLLHFHAAGVGVYKEDIVDWDLTFVAGARKSLMAIALGDIEPHRTSIDEIYSNIQTKEIEIIMKEEDAEEGEEGEDSPSENLGPRD
jgi:hypothetical protein